MRVYARISVLFLAAAILLFAGCDLLGLGGSDYSTDPISGTGANGDWTFVSGFVEPGFDAGDWSVELYPIAASTTNPWDLGAYPDSEDSIFFTAPSSAEERPLQLRLFGDTSGNQTVTYYANGTNYIITEGFITLTVDETAGTAVLKMDVSNDEFFFNGTVELPVAPD